MTTSLSSVGSSTVLSDLLDGTGQSPHGCPCLVICDGLRGTLLTGRAGSKNASLLRRGPHAPERATARSTLLLHPCGPERASLVP